MVLGLGLTSLAAAPKAKAFYVSGAVQTDAAPDEKSYFITYSTQEAKDAITATHKNEIVLAKILESKGWHRVESQDDASVILEINAFTIDRQVTITAQVPTYNNAAAQASGRHDIITGNSGPSGLQSTEAHISPDGSASVLGQGDSPDDPGPQRIEKTLPEKHLSLKLYNIENFAETQEVALYVDVDTVNREENIDMENCIGTLLQLACSYAEKQTDGYLVVNLKK